MAIKRLQFLIMAFLIFSGTPGIADELRDALSRGKASIDLRYRFEFVGG